MSITKIPAKTIVTCDVCRREERPRIRETVISIKRHALDFQGSPVADGSVTFDLCDSCATKIELAINDMTVEIRNADERKSETP